MKTKLEKADRIFLSHQLKRRFSPKNKTKTKQKKTFVRREIQNEEETMVRLATNIKAAYYTYIYIYIYQVWRIIKPQYRYSK